MWLAGWVRPDNKPEIREILAVHSCIHYTSIPPCLEANGYPAERPGQVSSYVSTILVVSTLAP